MITLKKLKWNNCFSYGEENVLDLNESIVTQLVGTNGAGKSSIPLILEEVLFLSLIHISEPTRPY